MDAELKNLKIDRTQRRSTEPSRWAVRFIVAGVILFMASPLADRIQGQTIVVDGGGAIQV